MSAQHGPGLAGIKVVECGQGVSVAYAAKMLADVGADVVKVEPPNGISMPKNAACPATLQRPKAKRSFIACWPMRTS